MAPLRPRPAPNPAAPGPSPGPALALVAVALAGAVLVGCGSSRPAAAPAPTTAPSTTTPPSTTTTNPNALPADPQPTTEQASAVFMDGWMAGDRARSASVATPAAVASLYATAYAGQPLNDRGCSDAFPPLICTWGPYAYGHGSIYQVQLSPLGSDWYVSGLTILS